MTEAASAETFLRPRFFCTARAGVCQLVLLLAPAIGAHTRTMTHIYFDFCEGFGCAPLSAYVQKLRNMDP
jgi:hypothetical protein